jgi:hypothetical protein
VRKQRQGMALLKQLSEAGVGGDFVKESVRDLAKFGQFKYQSDQQKLQILAMAPNDPRRAGMIHQMHMSKLQADSYFQSRGINIQNQDWPTSDGFDYINVLTDNLADFKTRLDQNYASLLQQHQYLLQNPMMAAQNGAPMAPQVQPPRANTASPTTTLGQAPQQAWPTNAQQQFGQAPQQRVVPGQAVQSRGVAPSPSSIPLVPLRSVSKR